MITGLAKLQRDLEQASLASQALDGEIAALRFDPSDPTSVEAAISEMEEAIDHKVAPFSDSEIVRNMTAELKRKYRDQILSRAAEASAGREEKAAITPEIDQSMFRQIENTVVDLKRADFQTFDRHIRKLSRLLHSSDLEVITRDLIENVDLEAWLQAGLATQGGMAGSATLQWPSEPEKELGIIVLLIDKFANKPEEAMGFARTFYYANSSSVSTTLQHMVNQMIVPFARDYIDYVKAKAGDHEAAILPASSVQTLRKVFIVHGHDDAARETVARFIEKLGFEAVILHERPNKGRTIITKFREEAAGVGFAIVLMTPDDVGGAAPFVAGTLKPRARQNVVFELGFFIGELGPERVAALIKGDIERPSDFDGVVYISLDNGSWKAELTRELEVAGYAIDWNKAMRA